MPACGLLHTCLCAGQWAFWHWMLQYRDERHLSDTHWFAWCNGGGSHRINERSSAMADCRGDRRSESHCTYTKGTFTSQAKAAKIF